MLDTTVKNKWEKESKPMKKNMVILRSVDLYDNEYGRKKDNEVGKLDAKIRKLEKEEKIARKKETKEKKRREIEKSEKQREDLIKQLSADDMYFGVFNNHVLDRNKLSDRLNYPESELIRIVKKIEQPGPDKEPLRSLLVVNVNNIKKYRTIAYKQGEFILYSVEWEKTEESGRTKYIPHRKDDKSVCYKRLIVSSSHVRNKKAIFIRKELYDDVNKILLCGMEESEYGKSFSKWNAYYGLAATDSRAVTIPENIIVVKDYAREISDICDIVTSRTSKNGKVVEYSVYDNVEYAMPVMPFDGAGLVSLSLAEKWAKELGLSHIPASFQIRAIPGIKGNLYTFDLKEFAVENHFTDISGNYFCFENKHVASILSKTGNSQIGIDEDIIILTESQVKFFSVYHYDIKNWQKEFKKPVELNTEKGKAEYRRTFNISECAISQKDVKTSMRTAYQHIQTVDFSNEEMDKLCERTVAQIKEAGNNLYKFLLNYSGVDTEPERGKDDLLKENALPFYKTAYALAEKIKYDSKSRDEQISDDMISDKLYEYMGDNYFLDKVEDTIDALKRNALAGKLTITGNYQVLTPDIYALAEYCFGSENPVGLLKDNEIYSNWWITKSKKNGKEFACKELAIIRNPHIYMEARIVAMAKTTTETEKWYQYQKTGIIMSSHSTTPYALGTADYDGDTVATTNNKIYTEAVKRAIRENRGNTIYYIDLDRYDNSMPPELTDKAPSFSVYAKKDTDDICFFKSGPIKISEITTPMLMAADIISFKNNIGTEVNKVTKLWAADRELMDDYLKNIKSRHLENHRLDQMVEDEYGFMRTQREINKDYMEEGERLIEEYYQLSKADFTDDDGNFDYLAYESYLIENQENKAKAQEEQLAAERKETEEYENMKIHYIKIMSIICQLTIDSAKTGDIVAVPEEISEFLQELGKKLPEAMKYTKKQRKQEERYHAKVSETANEKVINEIYFNNRELSKEEALALAKDRLEDYDMFFRMHSGTFNRISDTVEKLIEEYENNRDKKDELFNPQSLENIFAVEETDSKSVLYKLVRETLEKCANHQEDLDIEKKSSEDTMSYKALYVQIRDALDTLNGRYGEVLAAGEDLTGGKILDCIIHIIYDDYKKTVRKSRMKSILWNCYEDEMLGRIINGEQSADEKRLITLNNLPDGYEKKNEEIENATKNIKKSETSELEKRFYMLSGKDEKEIVFYESEITYIKNQLPDNPNAGASERRRVYAARLLCILIAITCSLENNRKGFVPSYMFNKKGKRSIPFIRFGRFAELLYHWDNAAELAENEKKCFKKNYDDTVRDMLEQLKDKSLIDEAIIIEKKLLRMKKLERKYRQQIENAEDFTEYILNKETGQLEEINGKIIRAEDQNIGAKIDAAKQPETEKYYMAELGKRKDGTRYAYKDYRVAVKELTDKMVEDMPDNIKFEAEKIKKNKSPK